MKVYVVNDSFCSVHGVFRTFEDAARKFEELYDRLDKEPDVIYLGRKKYHLWWENECSEQRDLYITEAELT